MKKIKKTFAMLLVMFSFITSVKDAFYPPLISVASAPTEKPTTPEPIEGEDEIFTM